MMIFRTCILVFAAFSLVACGTSRLRATKPNTVIEATGPTGVGYNNAGTGSLVTAFERDYLVSYCLDGGSIRVERKGRSVTLKANETCAGLYTDTNFTTLKPFAKGVSSTVAAERFTESGFRLTKTVCMAYFNRIGNQGQDSDFYKKMTNVLGGVTSATLGLTGSPSKSVALTATGFSGFLASLESFDEVYHFTPDRQYVLDLIMRSMNTYETEILSKKRNQTFNQAVDAILGYQSLCQTDYIRKTVNEAINSAKVRAFSTANFDRLVTDTLSATERQTLASNLGATALNDEQLKLLIRITRGEIQTDTDLNTAFEALKETGIGIINKSADTPPKFSLNSDIQSKVNSEIDKFRQASPNIYARYLPSRSDRNGVSSLAESTEPSTTGPVDLPVIVD